MSGDSFAGLTRILYALLLPDPDYFSNSAGNKAVFVGFMFYCCCCGAYGAIRPTESVAAVPVAGINLSSLWLVAVVGMSGGFTAGKTLILLPAPMLTWWSGGLFAVADMAVFRQSELLASDGLKGYGGLPSVRALDMSGNSVAGLTRILHAILLSESLFECAVRLDDTLWVECVGGVGTVAKMVLFSVFCSIFRKGSSSHKNIKFSSSSIISVY